MPGDPLTDFLQSIPPDRLQAILGSGSADQQEASLLRQLQQAHALRQQRMQNQPYGAGAGIGSGLASVFDALKERSLQKREDEALQKRQAGIDAFMQSVQGANARPPDMLAAPQEQPFSDKLQGVPPPAPPQPSGGGNMRGAALLALLSGNKQLEGIGQTLNAQPGIDLANQKTRQEIANAGPQKELGGQTPSTYEVLTKRRDAEKFAVNPVTGAIYDVRTGKPVSDGGTGGAAYDKRLPGMQQKFAQDFDPNIARGGVNKGNQERLNAANRLLAVATDPLTGGPADLTPQQMSEVSASLATLIGGGSSGEGTRHELTPFTGGRKLADVLQWFTNEPHGTGQQAFVQQMIATAKREQGVAQQAIDKSHAQRLSNHLQYYRTFPNEAKAQMEAYGIDPGAVDLTTGKYTPKAAVAPPQPAGPAPASPDATADLRKKYGL